MPLGGWIGADDVDHLAETRAFNAELERTLARQPSVHTVPPAVTRQARAEGRGVFPPPRKVAEAVDREVPGRSGPIGVRTFVPPGDVAGVYLHIHGGGWTLGTADQQDVALWSLARDAGVAVVSVDYQLAPEHPYPAAADNCEDVAAWLLANAVDEFGTRRLVVGGESAGAHLAVVTLLRLRDAGATPFAGAYLVFGAFDLSMTPSQRLWGDRNLILSGPIIRWFVDCFTPGMTAEQRRHPDLSPLYADLCGLPPARFLVGTLDPLLDDTLFMAARWRAAGIATELSVIPEAVHGFTGFPLGITRDAHAAATAFLRRVVGT